MLNYDCYKNRWQSLIMMYKDDGFDSAIKLLKYHCFRQKKAIN